MFKKIMCMLNPTVQNLEEIINNRPFDKKLAQEIIDSNNFNINEKNGKNESVLITALKNRRYDAAVWLIQKGIDPTSPYQDKSTIRVAVEQDAIDVVKALITSTDINLNQVDTNHRSLLQDAVIHGNNNI